MAFRTVSAVSSRPGNFSRGDRFSFYSGGGRQFSMTVDNWCKMTGIKTSAAVKKIVIDIFSRVIMRTPVDTGRARSNWVVGLNSPSSTPSSSLDTDAGPVTQDGSGKSKAKSRMIMKVKTANPENTKSYILTNNVVYAIRLEYGWSRRQAPSGMVRITLREFNRVVQRVASEIKKGNITVGGE